MKKSIITENVLDFKVNFSYGLKKEKTLNVEGSVPRGSTIVLCGESGCGKSTLLRCFNRLIPEFYEGKLEGYVFLNHEDISNKTMGEVGETVSSVFQDPRSQFFTLESDTEIGFGLENKGLDEDRIKRRIEETFSKFGLEYLRNREVFQLSSGERQLIAIMSAWAADAEVLLLDEPTANLDYAAIERLKELLTILKSEGKTMIISEHRLYYLKDLADEYRLIKNGEICQRFERKAFAALSPAELKELGLRVSDLEQIRVQQEPPGDNGNRLEIRNLTFHHGRKEVLRHLSCTVESGEVYALIGKNGAGKTTMGKCLCGLLKAEEGEIFFNGKRMSRRELIRSSLFVMQETEFQFFTNSVWKELKYGVEPSKHSDIELLLKEFDLWELRHRHPFSLSGGQMQKLTMMIAYLSDKKIVVLDEPTSGLDKKSLDVMVHFIRRMKNEKIVLVISHDLEFLAAVATKCLKVEQGAVSRSYELRRDEDLKTVQEAMAVEGVVKEEVSKRVETLLDPRTNLLFFFACMIAVVIGDEMLIMEYCLLSLLFSFANKRYQSFCIHSVLWGLIYGSEFLFPNAVTIFIAALFPRYLLIALLFPIVLGGRGATNMLAGLRKIGLPERIHLIFSVSFRFLPVLQNDFVLLKQSVKSRAGDRKKNVFQKVITSMETMIISTVFRVIRIGETLSASAETRGISLKRKKTSCVDLKMRVRDYFMIALTVLILVMNISQK